jgi:predicted extracellular nuclease
MTLKQRIAKLLSIVVALALVLSFLPLAQTPVQANGVSVVLPSVVISQVFGGGGNSGAPYKNDYVEIFNREATSVTLTGWSIQYASATGTGNFGANPIALLTGTIGPGQFYLVQLAGGTTGAPLPTPDATGTVNMSGSAGKVVLANTTTGLPCNGGSTLCPPSEMAKIVDLVGYGGANFYEGTGAAPILNNTTAGLRFGGGCAETNNNSVDFYAGTPAPRNSASPVNTCSDILAIGLANPNPAAIGGNVLLTVRVTPARNPASTGITVTGNLTDIGGSSPQPFYDDGSNGDVTAGDNVFSYLAVLGGSEIPCAKSLPVSISDLEGRSASITISLNVLLTRVIRQVQGAAHISPVNNCNVTSVTGIITAKRANGFYLQDPAADADPATSEGIFIYTGSAPTQLVSDAVTVSGKVTEYFGASNSLGVTEIISPVVTVSSSGNPLPAPVILGNGGRIPPAAQIESDAFATFNPDVDGIDFYESLESMLVQVNDALAVGPTSFFGSGAGANREIPVVGDNGANATILTPRGGVIIRPGDFNPERIILNDMITPISPLPAANVGDHFHGAIVGVIDYSFSNYKLEVISMPTMELGGLAREVAPEPSSYQLAIGTFNVENLAFTDPQAKFNTLAGLIVNNLKSPDILAIEEIQDNNGATDNGTVAANLTWGKLITAITTAGGPTYVYRQIDPENNMDGGAPGSNIRVGFMYRTDRGLSFIDRPGAVYNTPNSVIGSGASTTLQYSPGRIDPTNLAFTDSRKPLAGEFSFQGEKIFVIANHFNSKGGDDPLFGSFQPPTFYSETQRILQAQVVNNFVNQIYIADPNAYVVVAGDLNDFQFSNPMTVLKGTLLNALIDTLPENERYTYVYQGNSEALDHILFNNSLFAQTFAYDVVHINAEINDQASDHEPQTVNVTIDRTPPAFGACPVAGPFAYNTGTYSVGPISASDGAGSGINLGASSLSGMVDTSSIGPKTITFTVVDFAGNAAAPKTCSYDVTIQAVLRWVADGLTPLSASVTEPHARALLLDALLHLKTAQSPSLWVDGNHPAAGTGATVFLQTKEVVINLTNLVRYYGSLVPVSLLINYNNHLTMDMRVLAQVAIDDAIARGGNASKIAKAKTELNNGIFDASKGKLMEAIDHYRLAWTNARSA